MLLYTCYNVASAVLILGCQNIRCVTFQVQVNFCFLYDVKLSDFENNRDTLMS